MVTSFIEHHIKGTKLWKEAEQAARAEVQAERERLVGEIEAIRRTEEANVPLRAEKLAKARSAIQKAERALAEAQRAYQASRAEDHGARSTATTRISQMEQQLRQTAPEAINAFIQETYDLLDHTRATYRPTKPGRLVNDSGQERVQNFPNQEAFTGRINAIQGAIGEAETLKLSADLDIEHRLGELRRNLEATG
jgi:hypothetical protein